MIVFTEHRYYGAFAATRALCGTCLTLTSFVRARVLSSGDSLPYGQNSFTNANYVHLSSEQALADYALFLTSLKTNMSIPDAQVIAFGGSYGGMLSSWFRKKYPHIVDGAIAGSAPMSVDE